MNDFRKVLVVEGMERDPAHALSTELAELGFASVTASLEATEEVLAVIPEPSAIFFQMPDADAAQSAAFETLARRLRSEEATARIPILVVTGRRAHALQAKPWSDNGAAGGENALPVPLATYFRNGLSGPALS